MIKYLRSCALAAAALIVVLTGASMMGRLRENKYTAAGQTGNPVPGTPSLFEIILQITHNIITTENNRI